MKRRHRAHAALAAAFVMILETLAAADPPRGSPVAQLAALTARDMAARARAMGAGLQLTPPRRPTLRVTDVVPQGDARRTIGFVLGGVGIGLLVGSAAMGIVALGETADARRECGGGACVAGSPGQHEHDAGLRLGTLSTIGLVAGAASLATGIGLVLRIGSSAHGARARIDIRPTIGSRGNGVAIGGRW